MNDKFQINCTLKQHTPLIHFQHKQAGATLRATELKPKLDKFILTKLGKGNYEQGCQLAKANKWLVGKGEHNALDYKVKVESKGDLIEGEVEIMPSTREKWIARESTTLTIFSFNTKLIEELDEELIKTFFVLTNFGKRQSKGFGCFYPDSLNKDDFERLLKRKTLGAYRSSGRLRQEVQNDTYFYNNIIFRSWAKLKSGHNYNGYEKSRVFEYLADNTLRWDKRWIKRKLKNLIQDGRLPRPLQDRGNSPIDYTHRQNWEDEDGAEYRFGRAMLGLAEHYEYRAEGGYLYQVRIVNENIDRFKSPITFKVFGRNIYAFAEQVDESIYDTPFTFEVQKKKRDRTEGRPISIRGNLRTPSADEFNMVTFLDTYFETVGFNKIT